MLIVLIAFSSVTIFANNPKNEKARKEIAALNERFAHSFSSGDVPGMISCYTKDATFFAPHSKELSGKSEISKLFRDYTSQGKINFNSKTNSLTFTGNMAIEKGDCFI